MMSPCRHPLGPLLFILLWTALPTSADEPAQTAVAGERTILEGPWSFHWQQWVTPGDEPPAPDAWTTLPGSWTALTLDDHPLPAAGHASYRLLVTLGPEPPDVLQLRIPRVYSAYRLHVDGEPVAEVGHIGTTSETSRPGYGERRITLTDPGEELELVFHVSNFTSRSAGFPAPLELGPAEAVERSLMREVVASATLVGGLLLVGLSQLVLGGPRRDPVYLLFGATVILWAVHTSLSGELLGHLGWHLPVLPARWLDGLTALGTAVAYLLFLAALFPRHVPWRLARWTLAIPAFYLLVIGLAPELLRSQIIGWLLYLLALILLPALFGVARAWRQGEEDAGPILLGTVLVAATALLQAYLLNEAGVRQPVASAGVLAAVALHSLTLARRYVRAFEHSRRLEAELRRANQLKDDFLANTSHELRTPLHAMIGMAESLPRDNDRLARGLELIARSGHRLARLVDDILAFTRLRHDDLAIDPRPIRLEEQIHTVLATSRPLIGQRPVTLRAELAEPLPPVLADPDRLHQVLFNLVGNAIRFTDEGAIVVSAEGDGDRVTVRVADDGIGIDPDEFERLLDPYEQGSGAGQAGRGGVGLGLAISRRILERHGSRLTLAGEPGHGTRVEFSLAVADGATVAEEASPLDGSRERDGVPTAALGPPPAAPEGAPDLLVVDDSDSAAEVLVQQLALAGYATRRAASGAEALERVEERVPDLVLLDVMMPDMSGLEVCRRLRERFDPTTLPILLVTARTRPEDTVAGLEAGANDYLPKPSYRQELLARVAAQLRVRENEQMRWALKAHEAGDGDPTDIRALLVDLLTRTVRLWELHTGLGRADLAEQSGLWTVTLDGSVRKTRTLDRYLNIDTLPQRPRWGVVTRTARFVIEQLDDGEAGRELAALIEQLERCLA